MCHPRFNRWQMGSENQILAGGKVVFRGGWKFENQEVGQWLLYGQWPTFDQGFFRGKIGCCKLFEGLTYNDKKTGQTAGRWPELRWQK